ncbi:MAG TPA: FtsX-like permease family protein [Flavitalea sp.]|nr:FtsX-like permease family protein [Flavitalea sp.]
MIKNFFLTAYRHLSKNKMNTFLNVTGLAIGVVVCLLIGVWLQRELSFDNFHPNEKHIFRLSNTFKSESESFSQAPSGPAFGGQLPKLLPAVVSGCRLFGEEYKIKAGKIEFFEPNILIVDSNFFQFFGFRLKKGNATQSLQSFDQIVLTEDMATKYFGKQDPIGKTVVVEGDYPMIVTGIAENAPVNSQIQFDFLISFSFLRKMANEQWKFDIDNFWVGGWPMTYLHLKDPTKWKETETEINKIAAKYSAKEWKENNMSYKYHLQPIRDIHLKSNLRYDAANNGSLARARIFSIVGIIVLLLACINYINLTTAGAIKRAKETAVRKVIGAVRRQLLQQLFLETLIISTIAVLLGVASFKMVLPAFSHWMGQPYEFSFTTGNVLLFFTLIFFISIVAGIYPAAILSSFNPAATLKGNFSQSARGNFIRKALVVFQFTMTIALIASILIINQQMRYLKNKSLGFDDNAVVEIKFNGQSAVINQYNVIRNQFLKNQYILNVSKHSQNVVGGLGNGWTTTENLKGEEISTSLYHLSVDTTYFSTYNMQLAAGRFFSNNMPTDTTKSVLVNEAAVRTFGWQKPENAIGKKFGKGDQTRYVIGVVKDFNFESLHKPVEALLIGYAQRGNRLSVKIDMAHADEAISHIENTWKSVVPDVPLQYSFIDESLAKQYGDEKKMEGIFYGFSGLSLLIACMGLFGLSIFVVERKVKEIGVRKVLGASVSGIVALLSKDFLKLVLIAFLIACPLSWAFMNNWLQDFSYRINIGWSVFVLAGLAALLIALLTVSFQAIKAAIANPVDSLRME